MRSIDYHGMDEREKLAQAIRDARDMFVVLPDCPNCGGMLIWMDKEDYGGIRCVGPRQEDEHGEYYWELKNGCGGWFYTTTAVGLAKINKVPEKWHVEI